MFWIIIWGLIIIGFAIWGWSDLDGFSGLMAGALLGLTLGGLVAIIGSVTVGFVMSNDDNIEYHLKESNELIALVDNNGLSGSFFLGTGSVDSEQYYYYACEKELGIKVDKVKAEQCYIRYADADFRVEEHCPEFKESWRNWFATNLYTTRYVMYIPEGSITTEFSIDLK